MKIRNGFVSNSSSASFLILWQVDKEFLNKEENIVEEAFGLLFGVGSIDWSIYPELTQIYNDVAANTTVLEDGKLKTLFRTHMLNTLVDFGPSAAYFNLAFESMETCAIKLLSKEIRDET